MFAVIKDKENNRELINLGGSFDYCYGIISYYNVSSKRKEHFSVRDDYTLEYISPNMECCFICGTCDGLLETFKLNSDKLICKDCDVKIFREGIDS